MLSDKKIYSEIIKNIAADRGVTAEEVYADMELAIKIGFNNLDPAIQEHWNKLFPDGEVPTPEKLIEVLAEEIQKNNK